MNNYGFPTISDIAFAEDVATTALAKDTYCRQISYVRGGKNVKAVVLTPSLTQMLINTGSSVLEPQYITTGRAIIKIVEDTNFQVISLVSDDDVYNKVLFCCDLNISIPTICMLVKSYIEKYKGVYTDVAWCDC